MVSDLPIASNNKYHSEKFLSYFMEISSDYKCVIKWPVQWGDQDSYGHVNNTIYLRWFESGRIDYLTRIGFDGWMTKHKIGPILAAVNCNFRQQLKFPDTVVIGSRITHI